MPCEDLKLLNQKAISQWDFVADVEGRLHKLTDHFRLNTHQSNSFVLFLLGIEIELGIDGRTIKVHSPRRFLISFFFAASLGRSSLLLHGWMLAPRAEILLGAVEGDDATGGAQLLRVSPLHACFAHVRLVAGTVFLSYYNKR